VKLLLIFSLFVFVQISDQKLFIYNAFCNNYCGSISLEFS